MKLKPFKMGIVISNEIKGLNFNQMVYIINEKENFYEVKAEYNSKSLEINKDNLKTI
jgi:hypothetical protein